MADDLNSGPRRKAIRPCVSWHGVWAAALTCALSASMTRAEDAAAPADDAKQPAVESPLPPDYKPPLDPPKMMQIEKTLLTDEERTAMRKERGTVKKYMQNIRKGELRTETAKKDVTDGIRYQLNELTIPSNRKNLTLLRGRITGPSGALVQAGRLIDKAEQRTEFRRQLLQMVVDETAKLFDNNFYVRIHAALILGELNVVEEDPAKEIKAEPFSPAYKPLCQVLSDPEQPDSVKIVCTLSLIRILAIGNPNVEQKREMAQAIIAEILRKEPTLPHPWYQTRLVEALGYNDVTIDLDRKPFIYDCLISVVNDPDRHLRTRVQAAWSLGRHPEKGPDVPRMVAQVASLGTELAQTQAKTPKDPLWRRCAWVLYLAFENEDNQDLDAKRDPNRLGGLLNNPITEAAAKQAFEKVGPIVAAIIAEKSPTVEQVQDLAKWLDGQGLNQLPDTPQRNEVGVGNGP